MKQYILHSRNFQKSFLFDLITYLYYIVLLATVVLFSGCRNSSSESFDQANSHLLEFERPVDFDLDKIKERGTLIAIIDNSSTGYFIYKGQPMGYEYELLNLLVKHLGVELKLIITSDIGEAFRKLNRGEGDIIAHNLAETKERKNIVSFTEYHNLERQVLIQRKPDNWQNMKIHEVEKTLIRNPIDLAGKEVYVRKSSSYLTRLKNLSDEIGNDIIIVEEFGDVDTETLIKKVAKGEIDFTVADENIAKVNATYYPNIDIKTPISFPQKIGWALRKNSDQLLPEINQWIQNLKKTTDYYVIYNKYFKSPKASLQRVRSSFSSLGGNNISPYDAIFIAGADKLKWDWRLLASMAYQESKFDPYAESWAGAVGIMQLLPETAKAHGAEDLYNPKESIMAGVSYLKWLDRFWSKRVPDEKERIKFILASYNVGQGHIIDARNLARKYKKDPAKWEVVEDFLLKKSKAEYYNDPVVKLGYCRGEEPVNYVKEIMNRYQQYKLNFTQSEKGLSGRYLNM
jgi:membrane-bound lytic murein transglycosylase F